MLRQNIIRVVAYAGDVAMDTQAIVARPAQLGQCANLDQFLQDFLGGHALGTMYGPRRWGAGELEELYILCLKRAALGMAFLCQEAEAIDFSLPGEGTVNSVEEAMAHPAK